MTPKQLLKKVFPPMLATLAEAPPGNSAEWAYELKYDGFRAVIAVTGGGIAMLSRNELDLAPRFPRTYEALKKIKAREVVLDGEVVVFDAQGAPRFQLLQQGGNERLILFDILWLDGRDLRRLPYVERRAILEKAFAKPPAGIALSQVLDLTGEKALQHAKAGGWEGVIAKRKSSVYETRRSREWLKIKAINEQELVIVGWQPSNATDREIGSLHLAVNENGELRYAGKVGTGFSARMRVWLRDELAKDVVPKPLVKDAPRVKSAIWTKPRLIAQVAFGEWTGDHRLRHPAFLGLRDDKSVEEVVKEKPQSSKVTLTNPDRLIYPKDGITKKDVVAYYEAVAEPMLRALKDRPLALEHWNQGIHKPSWFHQSIGKEGPPWLTIVETPTRTTKSGVAKHLVADSVDALRWLAQMSALTLHMWSSRAGSLEEPDWILFDLDPAKGKGIEQAIEAAGVMRKVLDSLELPGVPKTSGKRGIHIFVPLAPGYTHEAAAEFACSVAAAVAAKVPGITVERALAARRGRLYLDCMQNGYGKTVVAPYSPRAIDGAPVSAPLKWSEITKKLDPLKYNIRTMPNRLAKVGDLFAAVFENPVKLPTLK
ncbi:MAG TPA: DNA ligase D [Thermoanaerobaculia bacterium]|nr:DNA ligase D [Thermoanaerobaculia bacterium]